MHQKCGDNVLKVCPRVYSGLRFMGLEQILPNWQFEEIENNSGMIVTTWIAQRLSYFKSPKKCSGAPNRSIDSKCFNYRT